MYWLDNTKPQGLSNCRANVSQEQHNLFVKLLQIWNSAFYLYHFLACSKCRYHFLISLCAYLIPTWDRAPPVTGSRSLSPIVVTRAAMTWGLWSRPPPATCSVLTQPWENGTAGEGWRYRAPSETLLTSACETHTETSGAILLGRVVAKTNSG